jgi:hypothetical protein
VEARGQAARGGLSDTRLKRGSAPLDLEGGPVVCAALVRLSRSGQKELGGAAASAWVPVTCGARWALSFSPLASAAGPGTCCLKLKHSGPAHQSLLGPPDKNRAPLGGGALRVPQAEACPVTCRPAALMLGFRSRALQKKEQTREPVVTA